MSDNEDECRSVEDENNPLGLIIHKVAVSRHATSSMTEAEADTILQSASQIFSQCKVSLIRKGSLSVFTVGTGSINSKSDFQDVCSATRSSIGGLTRNAHLVNQINWCGKVKPNVIGCANTPGICLVVVRHSLEANLWAHELGHTRGLNHRNDPDALMHETIGSVKTKLNSTECRRIRTKTLATEEEAQPNPEVMKMPNSDVFKYVRDVHVHGTPFTDCRHFSEDDAKQIAVLLEDESEIANWGNIVAVIGACGASWAFETLTEFVERAPSQTGVTVLEFRAKLAALISLGYFAHRFKDKGVVDFLFDCCDMSYWMEPNRVWLAEGYASQELRNIELCTAAIHGLSLSGTPESLQFLNDLSKSYSVRTETFDLNVFGPIVKEAIKVADEVSQLGLVGYYET